MRLSRKKKRYLRRICPWYHSISKFDWRNAWDVEMRYFPNTKHLLDETPRMTNKELIQKLEAIHLALKEKYS